MRKAFADTALLWIIVALSLLIQALLALGIPVPLLERTGAWRMATNPVAIAGLAAIGLLAMLALATDPAGRRRKAVAWALVALGLAAYLVFDPATAVILIATARTAWPRASGATPAAASTAPAARAG
jgi:hypothetical protein